MTQSASTDHAASDQASFAHPSSVRMLLATFFALVFLTIVTVLVYQYVPLGRFELIASMIIAVVKGSLVCLFFMHMIHDKGFNIIVFFSSFLFVLMFIGVAMLDSTEYQDEIRSYDREPALAAPAEEADSAEEAAE